MKKDTILRLLPWIILSPILIPFAIVFLFVNGIFDLFGKVFGPDEVPF